MEKAKKAENSSQKSKSKFKEKKEIKNYSLMSNIVYVFLFTNIFLFISSSSFNYSNFYREIALVSLLLILSLLMTKFLPTISVVLSLIFYASFIFWNFNYGFILAACIILGMIVLHFIRPSLKIPHFVYSLLPLFILLHIIWFNFLPLGFEGEWELEFGSKADMSELNSLYIIDERNVLSPTQSYGVHTWRSFEKDGTIEIGLNTEISLENKTVELTMEYEADGPIYVNGELFFDPAWGSSVNLGDFDGEFIYGADFFNLTIPYQNVELNEFLSITNSSSIEEFIFREYETNIEAHDGDYRGLNDLWLEREDLEDERNLSIFLASRFLNNSQLEDQNLSTLTYVGQLLVRLNIDSVDSLLKSPLDVFLESRSKSLQEFIDDELNNGPYPKLRPKNEDYTTVEEYIRSNFPDGVSMIDFSGKYEELEREMNSKYFDSINSVTYYPGFSSSSKKIHMDFRGPVSFYGVFKDSIEVNLNKRDMNLYNGSDEVTMTIKNILDEEVGTWTFNDNDGVDIRTAEDSDWVEYSYNLDLDEGIYKLEFDHTYESRHPDFILSNITFNSNKIMLDDRFLLWSPGSFYNNDNFNSILVRYWWNRYDQFILFDDSTDFYLNENDRGQWVEVDLSDKNELEFEKGFIWVIPEENLAVWENSDIDVDFEKTIQITKTIELENSNIDLVKISDLNITATEGTKISDIKITIK